MSVITQQFNAITGKLEWVFQPENYDWIQEVARSGYADMLHDTERNQKYYNGLQTAIKQLKEQNKFVRVLDIGTGSGLLSMMAVKCGADHVTACEAFKPMAKCALKIIKNNGMEGKIELIEKRSTELTVGDGCDLQFRANILVTEVFDTELIGEGALSTFKHALENLLEPDCIVIPSVAKVYAQVIESQTIANWHKAQSLDIPANHAITIPYDVLNCSGSPSVHDIQMSQLRDDEFIPITNPVVVHQLNFALKETLVFEESFYTENVSLTNGKCQAVFMWWDLEMTPGGETLSCAPYWAHPNPKNMQWRDHWMQAIYYPPKEMDVGKEDVIILGTHHDEYSYWFTVHKNDGKKRDKVDRPICNCGFHASYSRTRLGMMNDKERNEKLTRIYKKILNPENTCLCVGENIMLALITAKLRPKMVYVCEPNRIKRDILTYYLKANQIENVEILQKETLSITAQDLDNNKIDTLVSEPFFNSSVLPWDNIHFWYIRSTLNDLLKPEVVVSPNRAIIRGVAVHFKDLWKIRAPVGYVEGFNLKSLDKLVQKAIEQSDAIVEPQPLWEYPCVALSDSFDLLSYDFSQPIDLENSLISKATTNFKSDGSCNAVALWVDYQFCNENLSTGPIHGVTPGQEIDWYRHSQQGVYFFKEPVSVIRFTDSISFECSFKPKTGTTLFDFQVVLSSSTIS